MSAETGTEAPAKGPLREIVQPFIDLIHAPRALWGINVGYLIEGFCYFGVLQYLAMYFRQYAGLDDIWSQRSKMVLTAGITIAMFFFGGRADKWGVRKALLGAFIVMIIGRGLLAFAPNVGGTGMTSPMYLIAVGGLLMVVLGYGVYQPAAYAGVRKFTTPSTAAMGFAMLYALMNLGGWLNSGMSSMRLSFGISGTYWFYAGMTVVSLACTYFILGRRVVADAIAKARAAGGGDQTPSSGRAEGTQAPDRPQTLLERLKQHPLANVRFSFFIFCLIPVQTLFAYNFGTLQAYVNRAYSAPAVLAAAGVPMPEVATKPAEDGAPQSLQFKDLPLEVRQKLTLQQRLQIWAGDHFEWATNLNSLLIFILVPIVTALTQKRHVYTMMIVGTLVMAAPTFLLALGPGVLTLGGFIVLMTVGEAMWQPRFLQYAAQIAPEGRTGAYMGVAQLPWFLTKMLVPIYEGIFLQKYCPAEGAVHTEIMWFIFGCIAITSPIMLLLAKSWVGKDFKTKAD